MKELSNYDLLAILIGGMQAKTLAAKPLAEIFGFAKPRQMQLCEEPATYAVLPVVAAAKELFTRCLKEQMATTDVCLTSPASVKSFLCSEIGHLEHEAFWCLWLDSQHRMIIAEELFRGTLSQTSVYPREVVKRALHHNAAAVIFAHNHPSGFPQPSRADEVLTNALKSALDLVDVKVLDHLVIANNQTASFAERGLL